MSSLYTLTPTLLLIIFLILFVYFIIRTIDDESITFY